MNNSSGFIASILHWSNQARTCATSLRTQPAVGCFDATSDNIQADLAALFGEKNGTQQFRLNDGRVIEARALNIASGGWLTEHRDATRRVLHEAAIRDRKHLLDAVLDHMAHGLCAYDENLDLIVVNAHYLQIYGLTFEDARPGTPSVELMRRSIAHGVHRPGISAEEMLADFKKRLIDNNEPELRRHLADGRVTPCGIGR